MKKGRKWLFFLVILTISCSYKKNPSSIPIHFLSCSESPLLKIDIEGKTYTLKIDLGSTSNLMLKQRVLDQIQEKEFESLTTWYDIQGNEYHGSRYNIPVFKIGCFRIEDAIATEESEFFITTGSKLLSCSKWQKDKQLQLIDGRIGCSIFYSSVCYFDLSHTLFCFEMSIEDLKKSISLDGFIEMPFGFENGLVCIELVSEHGIKKFLLDTGASCSIARRLSFPNQGQKLKIKKLQIGSENFTSWSFHLTDLPEKLSWVDGVLGMDFFKKYAICLDFQTKTIYLK